ncbi:T9SS type A sorting domain-containing protein [bacterium]|nr:T9SS type A sorting domain-containing protein [bacterium]NUN44615.1 T9SS type A sorting domain-containing protein [bacterium]
MRKSLLHVIALLVSVAANVVAQDVFTLNATGTWTTGGNWVITRDGNNPGTNTYPGQSTVNDSPDGADIVIIPAGTFRTVSINAVSPTIGGLSIVNGKVNMSSNNTNVILTVVDSVHIYSGSTLTDTSGNGGCDLQLAGMLFNDGTLDFETASGNTVMTFNGSGHSRIYGSGTFDLRNLVMSKTVATDSIANHSSTFSQGVDPAATAGAAIFVSGVYSHQNPDTAIFSNGAVTVGVNARVHVPQGVVKLVNSTANTTATLTGALVIDGGIVRVSQGTNTAAFQSLASGGSSASLTMSNGGRLYVGNDGIFGDIRFDNGGSFNISGASTQVYAGRLVSGNNVSTTVSGTVDAATVRLGYGRTTAGTVYFLRGGSAHSFTNGAQVLLGRDTVGDFVADQTFVGASPSLLVSGSTTVFNVKGEITAATANVPFKLDINGGTVYVGDSLDVLSTNPTWINLGNVTGGSDTLIIRGGGRLEFGRNVNTVNATGGNVTFFMTGNSILDVQDGYLVLCANPSLTSITAGNLFNVASNVRINVGDGSGADSSAGIIVAPNLAAELPTPTTLNLFDLDGTGNKMYVYSDGHVQVGGGNKSNMRLIGNANGLAGGSKLHMFGGKINVTGSLVVNTGDSVYVQGGTLNIGLVASSGTNTITFNTADPGDTTAFIVDGGSVYVGDGNSVVNIQADNDNIPNFDTAAIDAYNKLEIRSGLLYLNGRITLLDPTGRFEMSGGNLYINPTGSQDLTGTNSILLLQRGVVNFTGGTITLVNPNPYSGTGVALQVNGQATVGGTTVAANQLSGLPTALNEVTDVVFQGTTSFGDGSASEDGSSDGFDITLADFGGSNPYGKFLINNPNGSNRHVSLTLQNSGGSHDSVLTVNDSLVIRAGEFRQNRNRIDYDGSGVAGMEIGSSGTLRISSVQNFDYFPQGFNSYTLASTSTVMYDGASTGTTVVDAGGSAQFGNLTISGNGTKQMNSSQTVRGTLLLTSATLAAGSNLTMASGSTIKRDAGTMTASNNLGGNDYTIEYIGTSKNTAAGEWSGTGKKHLKVNMTSGNTLTMHANLPTTGRIIDSLVIESGSTLADGGFEAIVSGNLRVNGTHSGTGFIRLDSATTHTITGDGSGTINRLSIFGVSGTDVTVTAASDFTINDSLLFEASAAADDRILHIGANTLTMGSKMTPFFTNISASSPARYITTNGSTSDDGMVKPYGSTGSFTWPFGVSGKYTPATIDLTTAAVLGNVTLKPINSAHPVTTDPTNLELAYYWIASTTIASPVVNSKFAYVDADQSGRGTESAYIPAKYTPTTWTRINDVTAVSDGNATDTIYFNGVSYITGDYTAGEPADFGSVLTYYSRQTGNWTDPNTWSTTGVGGSAAGTTPGSSRPVVIGSGHIVYVNNNNLTSASMEIQSGAQLDINPGITGSNFGVSSGTGTLILRSSTSTPPTFPSGDWSSFLGSSGGTVAYSGVGSYTLPSSPTTYNNLTITNSGAGDRTMPNTTLSISGNMTLNAAQTVYFDSSASGNVTIGGDLRVSHASAILQLRGSLNARTISVSGDVENSGTISIGSSTGSLTHALSIGDSLINNGTFNMVNGTNVCNVTFTGSSDAAITGSGTTTFNRLIVNKGTSQTPVLTLNLTNAPTINGSVSAVNKALTLTSGTLRLAGSFNFPYTISTGNDYTIPASARLWVDNSNATLTLDNSSGSNSLKLYGTLQISNGTVNVGVSAGGTNTCDISYDTANGLGVVPAINVSGGTLTVAGKIRPLSDPTANVQPLNYTQSAGTVSVSRYQAESANSTAYGVSDFTLRSTTGVFTMSGGTLNVVRRGASSNGRGLLILVGSNYSVSGGTVQILTSNFTGNFNCVVHSDAPFWNLIIGAGTSYTANIGGSNSAATNCTVLNDFTLNIGGQFYVSSLASLNAQQHNLVIGGSFIRQNGTLSMGFNTTQQSTGNSVLIFNGSGLTNQTRPQVFNYGGTVNLRSLTISNTNSDTVRLASGTHLNIARDLTISSGVFDATTNDNRLTFTTTDNFNQTITGNARLSVVAVSKTTANASLTLATGASLTIEDTLRLSNGLFNIGQGSLTILSTSASAIQDGGAGAAFSATRMIVIDSTTSSLGVTRSYPNTTTSGMLFPIGISGYYVPANIDISSGSPGTGTINVKVVGGAHPNSNAASALSMYWVTTTSGFTSAPTLLHTYIYDESDIVGTESSYLPQRYNGSSWAAGVTDSVRFGSTPSYFTDATSANLSSASFTAGYSFSNPVTFYSWNSGVIGGSMNWSDAATALSGTSAWSGDSASFVSVVGQGLSGGNIPGSTNPVVIRNHHTVTLTGSSQAASLQIDSAATLSMGAQTISLGSGVTGKGTIHTTSGSNLPSLSAGFVGSDGGVVNFGGTTRYSLPAQTTYHSLIISGTQAKILTANVALSGNLYIDGTSAGDTLDLNTFTLNRSTSGGSFTMDATTTLVVRNLTNFPSNYATYSFSNTSLVSYIMNGAQTIGALNGTNGGGYGNLSITRAGGTAITNRLLAGNTIVKGNLTVNQDCGISLTSNNYSLTVGGNLTFTGTGADSTNFIPFSGDLILNGSGTQTVSSQMRMRLYNVIVNGTGSVILSATQWGVGNKLYIKSGTFTIGTNNIEIGGSLRNFGTWTTPANTITFTGTTATDTIGGSNAIAFRNLTLTKAASQNLRLETPVTVKNSLTMSNDGNIILTGSNALTIDTSATVSAGSGSFSASRCIIQTGALGGPQIIKNLAAAPVVASFTFPIGYGSYYLPAVMTFGTRTGTGNIAVRAVSGANPNIIVPSKALDQYWTVDVTSFTNVKLLQSFYYNNAEAQGTETNYVPRYWAGSSPWLTPSNGFESSAGDVFGHQDSMTFTPGTYEWVPGEASAFNPPLYSRTAAAANSDTASWTNPNTWTANSDGSGAAAGTVPDNTVPVTILSGHGVKTVTNSDASTSLTLNGRLTIDSTTGNNFGEIDGAGTLILKRGSFPTYTVLGSDFFTVGTGGTVIYAGVNASYTLPASPTDYNNLVIDSGGTKTLAGYTTVNSLTVGAASTLGQATTLATNNNTIEIKDDYELNGSFTHGTGTVYFNGSTGSQSLGANSVAATLNFHHLIFDNNTAKTLGKPITTTGNLTITSSASIITQSSNDITVAGNWLNNGLSTVLSTTTGDVIFNSTTAAQSLTGSTNFADLTISKTGQVITLNDSIRVTGDLSITGGTLALANESMSINGNISNAGSITHSSGTVHFTGNSTQTLNGAGSASLNNVTVNGSSNTVAANANYDVTGNLRVVAGTFAPSASDAYYNVDSLIVHSGGTFDGANLTATWLSGSFRNHGTLTALADTTVFRATAAGLTVTGGPTFENLRIIDSGRVTLSSNTSVSDELQLVGGFIVTGSNSLILTKTATDPVTGGDSLSFVDGNVVITWPASQTYVARTFPTGNALYRFFRPIEIAASTDATPPTVRTSLAHSSANAGTLNGGLVKVSDIRYHTVTRTAGNDFTGSDLTARLVYARRAISDFASVEANLRVARSTDFSTWDNIGGVGVDTLESATTDGDTAGYILSNATSLAGLNSPTYFTLGTTTFDNSLPVELAYFRATTTDGQIRVEWRTESETENAYWLIQRREVNDEEAEHYRSTGKLSNANAQYQTVSSIEGQGTKASATDYNYLDKSAETGKMYAYRISDVGYDGTVTAHNVVVVSMDMPRTFALKSNYPNPFNPTTTIRYELPVSAKVTIKVYNILGQEVTTLVDADQTSGFQKVVWNGLNKYNQQVASGVYIYRMIAVSKDGKQSFTQTKKMMMLK